MSGAGGTKERAKQRYIKLKDDLAFIFIDENMDYSLVVLSQICASYFKRPLQCRNLDFYAICRHLEEIGILSYKNLTFLKEIVKYLPISSDIMVDVVNAAQTDINAILSILSDPGEGFHQKEPHAVSYDDLESIISLNVKNSIGFIKVDSGCGTGFRVGDCYIMTAYHVFKDKFESLCKMLTAMVEQSSITNPNLRGKLARLSDQFSEENGLNLTTCMKQFLEPNKKQLQFAALAGLLGTSFLERIETAWSPKTWIAFNIGTEDELRFRFYLDIPFADTDNDILIIMLRNDSHTRVPKPLHLEQFIVNNEMHLIGYLGTSDQRKSLHLNINCQVYCDDRQLATDINTAMQWWKEKLPDASLDPCRYDPGKDETPTGRTILHASKEFEQRSSGCPAVVIEDYTTRRLVVQLMYLSGYPTRHYETGKVHSPSLEYCFESGVSMKNVAKILLKAGQEELKKAIFS